jgi:putative restriction endonuclease
MMRYWWVNHNATWKQEISGGYLWSPQREKNARSTSYDNMRRIVPGDLIVSYAGQKNGHVGRATDTAVAAPKPAEFGERGSYWSNTGWYVPVSWIPLKAAVRHREFWDEIVPILPVRHSPLVSRTRKGNQKVYLAEVSKDVFDLIADRGGVEPSLIRQARGPSSDDAVRQLEDAAVQALLTDQDLASSVRNQLIAARVGQGNFRDAVLERERRCRVTGLSHEPLLVASHIKPWRSCATAIERLDGDNGLMLAPHIDRLFDRGFISFGDDGAVLTSQHLTDEILQALGCSNLRSFNAGPFREGQRAYLAYHRQHEFLDEAPREGSRRRKTASLVPLSG